MSHADEVYEHSIEHHDPHEGFDRSEPNVPAIMAFTAGSVILLVLIIVALQGYFEQVYQEAVYQKVLSAPSELLQDVRNRDDWNLTHYMYGDLKKDSGRVRIPVEQAMKQLADQASSGKLFYSTKDTPMKKEAVDLDTFGAPAAPAAAAATPAPPAAEKK